MKTDKNIGIWMDHSVAEIITLNQLKDNQKIYSNFTTETKEEVLKRSEFTMHNKEEQLNEAFFKKISEEILKYNHVLLFGPTNFDAV
ncbi:MAG: hypothetical protein ACI9XR_000045 [Flavobacterium sp.]|jgi:hypothetical protein